MNKWIVPTLLALSACSSTIDYRGKMPEPEDIAKVQVGVSGEEDVIAAIGSPTSTSQYGPLKWFYVYKKTSTQAFFKPDVLEESILTVSFTNGKVSDIQEKTPEGVTIDHVKQTTPTAGNDRGILKQVFGNFGRTMKKSESKK